MRTSRAAFEVEAVAYAATAKSGAAPKAMGAKIEGKGEGIIAIKKLRPCSSSNPVLKPQFVASYLFWIVRRIAARVRMRPS